ncbi:MAG: xanthine dehydrogenase family protein subunit M [Rhizobacter sp.]|nr:xanthine dehydrogenase family protein subunit M [Rhizobacter sp.]
MRPFAYVRADDVKAALRLSAVPASQGESPGTLATGGPVEFLAGGTNLLDYLKLDVVRTDRVVDINDLQRAHGRIEAGAESLRLGALVRMAELADDPAVNRDYPVIAQTMQLAASPQLRNMASLGGNVLQRTRCMYFRDVGWKACNKRTPGSGCAALDGENRKHAVLGVSDRCISNYPGDFAQALVALDARVETAGPAGPRTLRFEDLHRGADTPHVETVLQPGELITGFVVPAGPWTRRSLYVKVRDRQSYEYAVASAAVALDLASDGTVREARVGLGGVAYKPWRAREAEAFLRGKQIDEGSAMAAGRAAFAGAAPRQGNAFKTDLGPRTVARALLQAARLRT